jgi:hypothetical protein
MHTFVFQSLSKSAVQRPSSARGTGVASPQMRHYSAGQRNGSRPQSARLQKRPDDPHSAVTTPPLEDTMIMESPEGEITVAVPGEEGPVKGESD